MPMYTKLNKYVDLIFYRNLKKKQHILFKELLHMDYILKLFISIKTGSLNF